jgi:uncharacterized protein (DUF305 family)
MRIVGFRALVISISPSAMCIPESRGAASARAARGYAWQSEDGPSTQGYEAAIRKCTKAIIGYSGGADVDFVRGMILHHQGAIDMAKVELEYMKDPELRKLAEGIVAAQEKRDRDDADRAQGPRVIKVASGS